MGREVGQRVLREGDLAQSPHPPEALFCAPGHVAQPHFAPRSSSAEETLERRHKSLEFMQISSCVLEDLRRWVQSSSPCNLNAGPDQVVRQAQTHGT